LALLAARTASVTFFLCICHLQRIRVRQCSQPSFEPQARDDPPGAAPYRHFPDFKNSLRENQDAFATILLKFEAPACNQFSGIGHTQKESAFFPDPFSVCTVTAEVVKLRGSSAVESIAWGPYFADESSSVKNGDCPSGPGHESLTLAFCLATRRCMNLEPSFL
jgi:hypothetical protein